MSGTRLISVALALVLGLFVGVTIAKKNSIDPSTYAGGTPEAAADGLLKIAREQAGDGSWQNIYVSRIYYISGRKEEGKAIMDQAIAKKATAGDWIRIGRVYFEAGDWDSAKEAFEKVVTMEPNEEDWLAEIGAYFNLQGDRERAEELFKRSFELEPDHLKNTLAVAGSYLGVSPLRKP